MEYNFEVRFYYKGKTVEALRYMTYDEALRCGSKLRNIKYDKRVVYPLNWLARLEMHSKKEAQYDRVWPTT